MVVMERQYNFVAEDLSFNFFPVSYTNLSLVHFLSSHQYSRSNVRKTVRIWPSHFQDIKRIVQQSCAQHYSEIRAPKQLHGVRVRVESYICREAF